jgi:hypothetical protein
LPLRKGNIKNKMKRGEKRKTNGTEKKPTAFIQHFFFKLKTRIAIDNHASLWWCTVNPRKNKKKKRINKK